MRTTCIVTLVLVAVAVHFAECPRQANGDAQKASQLDRLPMPVFEDPIQRYPARILEYEHRAPLVVRERQRPCCPSRIEIRFQGVFMLEPPQALRRGLLGGRRHYY